MNEIARYVLRRHAIGQRGDIEISKEAYEELSSSISTLIDILKIEENFNVIIDNYFEFERYLLDTTLKALIYNSDVHEDLTEIRISVSRSIINLLTAARLYVESLPQVAGRHFCGEALDWIRSSPSRAYDRSLSYRIMDALRNYSQHDSLPIGGITIGRSKDLSGKPMRMIWKIEPTLDLKSIQRSAKFKKATLGEIQKNESEFKIKATIREYVEQIFLIHIEVRDKFEPLSKKSTHSLEAAKSDFSAKFPGTQESIIATAVDAKGKPLGPVVFLSAIVLKSLPQLRKRVNTLKNLPLRTVQY
ncbi:hypothetical protein ACJ4V0_14550 [Phreatobacter sp. HK31-P]